MENNDTGISESINYEITKEDFVEKYPTSTKTGCFQVQNAIMAHNGCLLLLGEVNAVYKFGGKQCLLFVYFYSIIQK